MLYNADCFEILQEMPDKSIDLIITDPPYGNILTKRNGNGNLKDSFKRYGGENWDYKPSRKYFDEMLRVSKNQVIWGGNYFSDYLPSSPCWIVWDKDRISAQSFSECELAWTSFSNLGFCFAASALVIKTFVPSYLFCDNPFAEGDFCSSEPPCMCWVCSSSVLSQTSGWQLCDISRKQSPTGRWGVAEHR